jgi:hypothetical protein
LARQNIFPPVCQPKSANLIILDNPTQSYEVLLEATLSLGMPSTTTRKFVVGVLIEKMIS